MSPGDWARSGTRGPDSLPDDIRARAIQDFGPSEGPDVYTRLITEIPERMPNSSWPRTLRCILYLADGDPARLTDAIRLCLQDPRDVMYAAEYDQEVRVRDFNDPFPREH